METRPKLKILSDRPEKPMIEPATPGLHAVTITAAPILTYSTSVLLHTTYD